MNYQTILSNLNNGITTITINRPNKLNALNKVTISELHKAVKSANDNAKCRVIIITGSGNKAFVAGADISEFSDFDSEKGALLAAQGQDMLFNFIERLETPVIAAVNGFALGGGLELAMACHFRLACTEAKMGLPEVSLGVIPGYGGTQRLPQLVGKGRAFEMIMTASMIDAETAKSYGLVNYVVPQEELLPLAEKIAAKIKRNSSVAIAKAITSVNANFTEGVNGYQEEIKQFGNCFDTADFKEGTTAFLQKRKAEFKGC